MISIAHQKSNFGGLFMWQIISVHVLKKIYLNFIHVVV